MNRRNAIKMGMTATGALMSGVALARSQPLKILILGGTGFIGPHFVRTLREHGHTLTLFNRGKRNPGLFPDVETLIGDRNGPVDALKNRDWDAVIDDSGYLPKQVRLTTGLLRERVRQYLFISSISAYADFKAVNIDEDYPLAKLANPDSEDISADYGALKAACEQIVVDSFGKRSTIVRPTYIVGPGDHTDRFTYWPVRVSRGGEMLAPGAPDNPVQFIDVRDLAEFVRVCVEQQVAGRYNACNPPRSVTMGQLLDASKQISGAATTFTWVSPDFLESQHLLDSNEIPIWAPAQGDWAGFSQVSCAHAVATGLRFTDLSSTVADTLKWHQQRPAAQQTLRAGLAPQREAELLALWKAQSAAGGSDAMKS